MAITYDTEPRTDAQGPLAAGSFARKQVALGSTECEIATGDRVDVRHFEVVDAISTLFEIKLTVVSDNPDIDFDGVIGQPMRFSMNAGKVRTWSGVCADARQMRVEEAFLSTYELTLVPALWLASQRRNYRMFQHKSELEIVEQLLAEWEITPVKRLSEGYKKRKYRVQYGETDYAFICRMLEDAGVSFYFVERDGQMQLVLDDNPQTNAVRDPIPFRDRPQDAELEHVTAVQVARRVRPGRYTMRDHDYRRQASFPLVNSAAETHGADDAGLEGRLERYHYVPGAMLFASEGGDESPTADDRGAYRADQEEGSRLARRRLDAQRTGAREVVFKTNTVDVAPGVVLSFRDHPKSELADDKTLLVLESRFSGSMPGKWSHEVKSVSGAARFVPPLSTPKPRVSGVESATVVGPAGEEIHTDEFGRVRVHFHWDRESRMDENSSCWIHVSQPWSGAGFGGTNLPRIGQEVIVDFLGGDPDRPIIVGRVYTNLQKTPYGLPANKTQSGWKSYSSPATGGFNEFKFEDAAGNELVSMQAEKDMQKLVKNNESTQIGNDRMSKIGGNEAQQVGKDFIKQVMQNAMEMVGLQKHTQAGKLISLVCGKSSFSMDAEGNITLKGTKILIEGEEHLQGTANRIDLN
ncbi:MAG: type VI secretion system tip protein VgrG [Polyangiaceae bacterium]|nr:type VI secretion system tip protein VgrG [Polyangiaceae bacterium]